MMLVKINRRGICCENVMCTEMPEGIILV